MDADRGAAGAEGDSEGDEQDVVEESVERDAFRTLFQAETAAMRKELADLSASEDRGDKAGEVLDALFHREQILEAKCTRITDILPRYDQQRYRSALKTLVNDIGVAREALAPRKKFSFARKKPASTAVATPAIASVDTAETSLEVKGTLQTGDGELIANLHDVCFARGDGELAGRDVTLRELTGCRVVLLDRVGALHCHELRQCHIVVGAIASSALIYDCHDCIFTLAAKQLRLHRSENIGLHLHTLSLPAIEHSRRIQVAPFDVVYPLIDHHWSLATLGARPQLEEPDTFETRESSAWSKVQDFNWHKRQASPNWCVMPRELRRQPLCFADAFSAVGDLSPSADELDRCRRCWEVDAA